MQNLNTTQIFRGECDPDNDSVNSEEVDDGLDFDSL